MYAGKYRCLIYSVQTSVMLRSDEDEDDTDDVCEIILEFPGK